MQYSNIDELRVQQQLVIFSFNFIYFLFFYWNVTAMVQSILNFFFFLKKKKYLKNLMCQGGKKKEKERHFFLN